MGALRPGSWQQVTLAFRTGAHETMRTVYVSQLASDPALVSNLSLHRDQRNEPVDCHRSGRPLCGELEYDDPLPVCDPEGLGRRCLSRVPGLAAYCTHLDPRTGEELWSAPFLEGAAGEPISGADVGGPVPVQMWEGRAQSRCRCGRGESRRRADVGGARPVTLQMRHRVASSVPVQVSTTS